jgi:hypothetical protein
VQPLLDLDDWMRFEASLTRRQALGSPRGQWSM